MKKRLLTIELVMAISLMMENVVYSQTWISFDGSNPDKDVTISTITSNVNEHKIKVNIHGLYDKLKTVEGVSYHHLSLKSCPGLSAIGEPQLPVINQFIAIPEGARYEVTLTEKKWTDLVIGKVYPSQKDVKDTEPEPPFQIVDSIYRQEVYAPFLVWTGKEQKWRNIRNVGISICPFKYYPVKNELSVLSEFELTIKFSEELKTPAYDASDVLIAHKWGMFDNDISTFPTGMNNRKETSSTDTYDYLIIVGDTSILSCQAFKDFCKWKAFKGYKIRAKPISEIGTSAIKNYISSQFDSGVRYVLLVGDFINLPLQSVGIETDSHQTATGDYWYGCLTGGGGGYFADIPIGRFPVSSQSDFENMVYKTIYYEGAYDGNYKKTLLVAHKGADLEYQNCSEFIRSTYNSYLSFTKAYGSSLSNGGNEATNSDVVSRINSGMHIVNYRGHGEEVGWGYPNEEWNVSNELFNKAQIDNIETNSIYFNVCCQTGDITYLFDPCFMEAFTRSCKGAIACLAATDNIWRLQATKYNQNLFSILLTGDEWNIGNLNIMAHKATINYFITQKNKARFNALVFMCGGDPTLEIWTGTPSHFSDINVSKTGDNVIVSSSSLSSNDMVSVVSEDGELIGKYTIAGNSCMFPIPTSNFYIAVNRHNYYPYIRFIARSGYIQNETINSNITYSTTPIYIGYDVTLETNYGNVVINPGAKLTIQNGNGGVTIKNGFECKSGAEFVVE